MITSARIRENLKPAPGIEWITALRAPAIKKLASAGVLQLSLFDDRDLAEITHPDFPGERLIACFNPLLAEERARKRPQLLAATEKELKKIAVAVSRQGRVVALRNGREQRGDVALRATALRERDHQQQPWLALAVHAMPATSSLIASTLRRQVKRARAWSSPDGRAGSRAIARAM